MKTRTAITFIFDGDFDNRPEYTQARIRTAEKFLIEDIIDEIRGRNWTKIGSTVDVRISTKIDDSVHYDELEYKL